MVPGRDQKENPREVKQFSYTVISIGERFPMGICIEVYRT
jgi:hypothetical protein